jgi:dienelactone hydrolase
MAAAFWVALALAGGTAPAPEAVERGVVVERVTCRDAPDQSYALYLPSTYTPDRLWPILYAFDPAARGALPVGLAKAAAERRGWIVAGSHNARNGPWPAIEKAMAAMLRDTQVRFAIDARRVYATGFSGGARVAAALAASCGGCVAGVFAHGAGLPTGLAVDKSGLGFAWYAAAGEEDFNYGELFRLDEELRGTPTPQRLRIFRGGHEWAPADVWDDAVDWLELRAMREGRRPPNAAFVAGQLGRAVERAARLEAEGDLLGAAGELRALARDFAGSPEAAVAEGHEDELVKSRAYRDAEKGERAGLEEGRRLVAEFGAGFRALREGLETQAAAALELRRQGSQLAGRRDGEKDPARRRMFVRAAGEVFAQAVEGGQESLRADRPEAALLMFEVASAVRPDAYGPHLQRARAFARRGKPKDVVRALRRASELGADGAILARFVEGQPELSALKSEPGVRELLGGR